MYAFCNDNVKECYDIKMSNKRPKRVSKKNIKKLFFLKSTEVNEVLTYDTRVELIDGIMEAMEHGYGSCDLGFYKVKKISLISTLKMYIKRYNDANPGEREALANIDTL